MLITMAPLCVFLWLFVAIRVQAGPYTDLFVFGDSLSDVGNTSYWTTEGPLAAFAPDTPGDAYWEGRFSNGPVYSEWLAEGLGFAPLETDTFGGNNFAYGGAYTSGSPIGQNFYVDDLDDQLEDYFDTRTTDPDALYTVLIGANDFILGERTDVVTPAARVGDALQQLATAGAANFLVLNLPLLGLTPSYNDTPAEAAEWNARSEGYNGALASELDAFEIANPTVNLFRLDLAGLLSDLVTNAAARGFTNNFESAAPGLEPGDSDYDQSLIAPNPDEYLFWDGVHPTRAVHRLLGFEAVRAVLPAGDYDRDGFVSGDDFSAWLASYGSTSELAADGNSDGRIDAVDYAIWRENRPGMEFAASVPEPSTLPLLLVASLLLSPLTAKRRPPRPAAADTRRTRRAGPV